MEALLTEINAEYEIAAAARKERREAALAARLERWENEDLSDVVCEDRLPTGSVWSVLRLVWPNVSSDRAFSSLIGVGPTVIALLWLRYGIDFLAMGVGILEILIVMNWLTTNPTFDNLASSWNCERSTVHKLLHDTILVMYEVLDEVSWHPRVWHNPELAPREGSLFHRVTFCLDGIECGLPQPTAKIQERAFYSDKKGTHAIKYETCTQLSSGRIMWIGGGVFGSVHDMTVTQHSGLLDIIPPGERGLADKGYEGLDPSVFLVMLKATKNGGGDYKDVLSYTVEEHEYNRSLATQRIEIERVNGRLKRFAVLEGCRIRDRNFHHVIFTVICNITNIWMELKPMRRHVHPLLMDCQTKRPARSILTAD